MWFEFSLWNSFEILAYLVLSLRVNMAGGRAGGSSCVGDISSYSR